MDYILTPEGELYHYGVKGMKWGVRRAEKKQLRAQMRADREVLRKKYNKEYGVDEEWEKADKAYDKAYKKLGREPDDPESFYEKADSLGSKAYKQMERDMRRKYGKDYDKMIKSDARTAYAIILGGTALSIGVLAGGVKLTTIATNAAVNAGIKAVTKMMSN